MKTEDLISAIAADTPRKGASLGQRVALALTAGGAVSVLFFAQTLGVRPDFADAMQTWDFPTKLLLVAVCFALALWGSVRLARPDVAPRSVLAGLALVPILLLLAIGVELMVTPAQTWPARAVGSNSLLCLAAIPVMAIAPLAALLVALRAGAPASPALAGAVAGLLAGGLAATLYAAHCFDDSPLFVALWYTPGIALAVLAGMLAGRRVLRW